jgi:CBS domain-containing protein
MEFNVKDWMIDLVVYVDPESTVADALATMRRRYIHSLIVSKGKDNPDFGILTSTDICDEIVAKNQNPITILVKDVMTSPLITVNDGMPLQECAAIMKDHRIHHLPVANAEGELVGMISATDFLVAAEAMSREPGDRFS